MTLTLDTDLIDITEWNAGISPVEKWLEAMWGIRAGVSSPRPTALRVHPDSLASAGWLTALWGFAV